MTTILRSEEEEARTANRRLAKLAVQVLRIHICG